MKFSSSMLKTWATCQLQAHYDDVYRFPGSQHAKTTFGTIIHYCLEGFNNDGDLDFAKERFLYFWEHPEDMNAVPDTWRGVTYGGLRERGLKILDQYSDSLKWEPREVIATEHKFCFPWKGHELSGIVDLLEFKASGRGVPTLKIVDYKTASKKPTLDDLRLDIQFTIYVLASMQPEFWMGYTEKGWHPPMADKYPPMEDGEALYERFLEVPRRASWYHLWGNAEIDAGERTEADFDRLYRLLEGVAKAKELEVFIPSIRSDSCLYCPYKEICPAVEPILDKLHLEPGGEYDDAMF